MMAQTIHTWTRTLLGNSNSPPTQLRYRVRFAGAITDPGWQGFVYGRPDSFFVHRPFDGGVQLGTGGPAHGAQAIRPTKNILDNQSGSCMYTTYVCLFQVMIF